MAEEIKRVLSLVPDVGNNQNSIGVYAESLSASLRERGLQADVTYVRDRDFLAKLFTAAPNPDTVIYCTNFFMDLRLSAHLHFNQARLNDLFPCKTVALVADHPFIGFMWERISNCHNDTLLMVSDTSFVEQAKLLQPGLSHFRFCPAGLLDEQKLTNLPMSERDIDVLIPLGNIKREIIDEVRQQFSFNQQAIQLLDAVYETLRGPVKRSAFHVFTDIFQQIFGSSLNELFQNNRQAGLSMLQLLSTVDRVTRNERRRVMMQTLLRDRGPETIHLVGDFSDLPVVSDLLGTDQRLVNHGFIPADDLCDLMVRAKSVVHAHPNITECLHERVVNSGARGCMLISDFAPVIADTLGDDWVEISDQSISDIFSELSIEQISEMGQKTRKRILGKHTMGHCADDFIAGIKARWG